MGLQAAQIFPRWNPLTSWMRQIEDFQRAAYGTPFLPNQQFAFSSPPPIRENLHVVDLRVEIPVRTSC